MNVQELKNKFEEIANAQSSIGTFVFDDLSAINTDRNKSYPVILMKTPQSVMTPFTTQDDSALYENYTIVFYCLTTWTAEDKKTIPLEQRYKECDLIANTYLRTFLQDGGNIYSLFGDKSVSKNRGHHQHVDMLVGVNYTFTLRVWNSLC